MLDIIPPTFTGSDHEKVEQMGEYINQLYDSINRQSTSQGNSGSGGSGKASKDFVIYATLDINEGTLVCDCSFGKILANYIAGNNIKLKIETHPEDSDEKVYLICYLSIISSPFGIAAFMAGFESSYELVYAVCHSGSWYLTTDPFEIPS